MPQVYGDEQPTISQGVCVCVCVFLRERDREIMEGITDMFIGDVLGNCSGVLEWVGLVWAKLEFGRESRIRICFRFSYWSSWAWWMVFPFLLRLLRYFTGGGFSLVVVAEDQHKSGIVECGQCWSVIVEWIVMLWGCLWVWIMDCWKKDDMWACRELRHWIERVVKSYLECYVTKRTNDDCLPTC